MEIIICKISLEFVVFISNIAQLIVKLLSDSIYASVCLIAVLILLLSEIRLYEICFEVQKDVEFCHLVLCQWPQIPKLFVLVVVEYLTTLCLRWVYHSLKSHNTNETDVYVHHSLLSKPHVKLKKEGWTKMLPGLQDSVW